MKLLSRDHERSVDGIETVEGAIPGVHVARFDERSPCPIRARMPWCGEDRELAEPAPGVLGSVKREREISVHLEDSALLG
jgi:hypothetical protein